jgi:hypothetical protein
VYSEPCTCPIPPTEINHGYMSKSLLLLVLYTKAGGARLWRSGVGSGPNFAGYRNLISRLLADRFIALPAPDC